MFSLANWSSTECCSASDFASVSPLLGVLAPVAPPPPAPPSALTFVSPELRSLAVGITFDGLSPPPTPPPPALVPDPLLLPFFPLPAAATSVCCPKLARLPLLKLFLPPIALARTLSALESESKNLLGALTMGGEEEERSEK